MKIPKAIGSLDLLVQPCNSHLTEVLFSKSIPRHITNSPAIYNLYDHYSEKLIKNYLCNDQQSLVIIHIKNFIEKYYVQITQDKLQNMTIKEIIDYINKI
ncbi:hypothetical protein ACTFIY_007075 [Dictyostelium cf. discoideum]